MKWGRKWGNLWGRSDFLQNIKITDLGDIPPLALVEWDAISSITTTIPYYHLLVDGKFYDTTTGLNMRVQFQTPGRHFVQIIASSSSNKEEDLTICIASIPGSRGKLDWTASPAPDVEFYEIYSDLGLGGGPSTLIGTSDGTETCFITDVLADGTYEFRVDPCDFAGNCLTSSFTTILVISSFPLAPSNLVLDSYDEGTDDADFSFTESITAGVTEYRIFSNGGGISDFIDYTTVLLTIAAPVSSFVLNLPAAGTYKVGIRAFDGTSEEDNVDVFVRFTLV